MAARGAAQRRLIGRFIVVGTLPFAAWGTFTKSQIEKGRVKYGEPACSACEHNIFGSWLILSGVSLGLLPPRPTPLMQRISLVTAGTGVLINIIAAVTTRCNHKPLTQDDYMLYIRAYNGEITSANPHNGGRQLQPNSLGSAANGAAPNSRAANGTAPNSRPSPADSRFAIPPRSSRQRFDRPSSPSDGSKEQSLDEWGNSSEEIQEDDEWKL